MPSRQLHFDRKEVIVCLCLFLAVCVVFGQAIRHEFVNLDDPEYVYENPHVSQGLTAPGVVWAFTQGHKSMWIPTTWVSLMMDWNLYDVHAGGYHLTNLLLHAAAAMMLFLAMRRMTDRFWPSVAAAALFAVHPLKVESVVWITERKDVLSGMFFSLTLLAYIHYTRERFSLFRYVLVCIPFVLGLLAKPMLATVPMLLLLLDYWPLGRLGIIPPAVGTNPAEPFSFSRLARLVVEKIPLLALAIGDCVMTLRVQTTTALESNQTLTLFERLQYAAIGYVTYLGHFFYPFELAAVYPRESLEGQSWKVVVATAILAVITVAVLLQFRKRPYLFVGWFWYLGMLVPVAGFVQVGITAIADRFCYLPIIGIGIALAWGIADWCGTSSLRRRACGVASVFIFSALAACSAYETSFWSDGETLWLHVLRRSPGNYVAHNNYGSYLVSMGRSDEAITHFEDALRASPNNAIVHYNFGCLLMNLGKLDEAKDHLWQTLQCSPHYIDAYERLGSILNKQGQYDMAIAFLEKGIEIAPRNAELRYDLGKALLATERKQDAQQVFDAAAKIMPDYAERHMAMGMLVESRGRFIDAITHYGRAVDVRPEDVVARNSLARALTQANRENEAIAQYEAVLKIEPKNVEAKESLERLRSAGRQSR